MSAGRIRAVTETDLPFLVHGDLRADGEPLGPDFDAVAHRAKIAGFVGEADDVAWVHEVEDSGGVRPVGMLMARFRDPVREREEPYVRILVDRALSKLPAGWWSPSEAFAEVFQLWVEPTHRRRGIATGLKRHLEVRTRERGLGIVYTHTLAHNSHVVELNRRLGYIEACRGGLWDSAVRVSMVKRL